MSCQEQYHPHSVHKTKVWLSIYLKCQILSLEGLCSILLAITHRHTKCLSISFVIEVKISRIKNQIYLKFKNSFLVKHVFTRLTKYRKLPPFWLHDAQLFKISASFAVLAIFNSNWAFPLITKSGSSSSSSLV